MGVSAEAAARAAGVSRVTWHRMEAGAPGVAAGSYARALDALGLAGGPEENQTENETTGHRPPGCIPTRVRVGDYPELQALAWSLRPDTLLTPRQALAVYEQNAAHLDDAALTDAERSFMDDLREALADDVLP